jgi:quercetin dioxygenase-like cupin family protein
MVHVSTLTGAQHCNWESVRVERIGEGIERQMIVEDQLMICRLRLEPHVDMPAHEHPHEQITIVERGRVRFVVGDQERIAHAGDVFHFPSGCWHGATMLDGEVVLRRYERTSSSRHDEKRSLAELLETRCSILQTGDNRWLQPLQ